MSEWQWSDRGWRERVGDDRRALLQEALRRAVHLRDGLAEGQASSTEAVMLVDVLNEALDVFGLRHDDIGDPP